MIYGPGNSFLAPEWVELDRKLRAGDGLGWSGDPCLWLGIGVVIGKQTGKRGHRLEVWRDHEDGRTEMIDAWHPAESWRILHDLTVMRAGAEGRTESVVDRIDAANAKKEKEESDKFADKMGEMMDHALRLRHDLHEPKNVFRQVGGLLDKDGSPTKAESTADAE